MTEANVLALRFDESGHAYQALGRLREAESRGLLTINQAVVIRRSLDGSLSAPDDDYLNGEGLLTGTMIGGLVGLLGGPIGPTCCAGETTAARTSPRTNRPPTSPIPSGGARTWPPPRSTADPDDTEEKRYQR